MRTIRTISFITGVAAGLVAATAAMTSMYPDVPRRMMRDSRRIVRGGRRVVENMFR